MAWNSRPGAEARREPSSDNPCNSEAITVALLFGIAHLSRGSAAERRTAGERAANQSQSVFPFLPRHFQAWGAHAGAAHAGFLLYQLDELHKFRNGIHAQEGQEPAVEVEGLPAITVH